MYLKRGCKKLNIINKTIKNRILSIKSDVFET
jgi:hypothetical protein